MRMLVASLALVGMSSAAAAQDRGSLALDLMTTAGRHVGFGYYLTDGLSLRPSFGVGFSSQGTEINVGTDLRFEPWSRQRISPYATAGFHYLQSPYLIQYDASGSVLPEASSGTARFGGGVGVRAHLKYGLSAVAEGRVMNSELRDVTVGGLYGQAVRNAAHFEAAVGVSYAFN